MSKLEQTSFENVLSVNPYTNRYFVGTSSFITESKKPEFEKNQLTISYLNTSHFINSTLSISKNIPEEDLFDAIYNKIYDDLGLDQAVEYSLQYIESFNTIDDENRYFQVFIVDPLSLQKDFETTVQNIQYLDIIIPSPLLIKSLYTKELIQTNGVHCFIYFQENDAFVTIYENREFVYTKSIKYSFIQMHERLCELYGEKIDYDDFLQFFSMENLKDTTSDYKNYFLKLYKELFANINDILTYAKRAFEIDSFDQVYIGSQIETVTKLDEILEVELNIKTSEFEFNYGYDSNGQFIDQLQYLMQLYTTIDEEDKYLCNFSIYHRPPTFVKRESGKLLITVGAAFALAFAYPVTYWALTYAQELQNDLLKTQFTELHIQKTTREATIKSKFAEKEKASQLLSLEKNDYIKKKNTLIKIHEVKVDYPMKAKLLTELTKDLNRFKVNLENIRYVQKQNTKTFTFSLISPKDKEITKLVEFLTKTHDKEFTFSLEEISYDEKENKYFSELKVEIL